MVGEKFIRVLHIDLTAGDIRTEEREDLMPYLGGAGVAAKLLQENFHPGLAPTSPKQPIVFAIGAGTFIFPVLTKVVATFLSPLTGEYGESHAAGRLGMAMLMAGYDAIVITGRSRKPCYLAITDRDVNIREANSIWGLLSEETGRIIRDRENAGGRASGRRSIIRIGPAGENGVAFASVNVDTYRHFGRLGLGAAMGSKHLKGMSVFGERPLPIANPRQYFKVYREIYHKCVFSAGMRKYHDLGTPVNVKSLNKLGAIPTLNLKAGRFEHADDISGEAFAEKNLVRKMACAGCPVGCIHIGMYRHEFDKGQEYEAINVTYDYELIFALGSFLGIRSTDEILAIIQDVEEFGVDAMSVGVCLGWATEALERGIITREQTLTDLRFGHAAGYIKALGYLTRGTNEFYRDLGRGSRFVAEKYGGEDYAMQLGGNEMTGYHTGYAATVGQAVGARHSHLCNAGYSLDQGMKSFDEDKVVDDLFREECDRCMATSLVMCLFARRIYDDQTMLDALGAVGWDLTPEDLVTIGKRIYQTKLQIKRALGFDPRQVRIPKRFFETPTIHGVLDEGTTYRMIGKFADKADALLEEDLS
ncbi:MAG: aldehyde:ferredoxin oxidoreductase [Oscillospiraceae bacterium]|nr:aldehyde:ferredoxin oxidoreductase [Oscillospiraceae bacterium]